ncbi:hypothetical protein F3J44_22915 [Pantoea sp. Tr-811]|uniref:hypothetical protein n=1 Tax=unclassified Pantoea TaxID=2630326 RepID=UPI00141E5E29|nr:MULTISPECIES: hypothetical protein [unclassified Pantoea]NIE74196.1 hypothetical protein [Pantoea sp. Ap-967]NIF29209.1 hypothetical protein [Pantoea sp. Tr-811]
MLAIVGVLERYCNRSEKRLASMRQPAALPIAAQFVCTGNWVTISETIQPDPSIRQKPESFSGSLAAEQFSTTSLR